MSLAGGLRSLLAGARNLAVGGDHTAEADRLFRRVDPAVDGGEACLRDCASCPESYPRNFRVEERDALYGRVRGWATHALVATGRSDWARDVADERGSVMAALDRCAGPGNGRLMVSASDIPTPHLSADYSEPTTVLLLPAFVVIENVTPASVPQLVAGYIDRGPTTATPLEPFSLPRSLDPPPDGPDANADGAPPLTPPLTSRPCPHAALVLLCSQRTRDARCGQSAPLLRRELARHLRPLGLWRDPDDERPGGVAVCFVSHVGGHKYSANVMVYRRPDAFGLDGGGGEGQGEGEKEGEEKGKGEGEGEGEKGEKGERPALAPRRRLDPARLAAEGADVGAAQCIWLARVRPEHCEALVRYTILQGKVQRPERQLRGGFDRARGVMSW